ncbi:MAG: nitroreductase family protein [Vallitalea sp.]|jgi:nitroreductase|nr:nitroreductase family protein [Vallitalea sp.]
MKNLDFIYNRHSVRKFTQDDIPMEDLKKILEASTYCCSAKNAQNWHFVIIKNQDKANQLAKAIEEKNTEIANQLQDEKQKIAFKKFVRFATFFKDAPITILVYCSSYVPTGLKEMNILEGYEEELKHIVEMSPQMQNIGALIQSLLLAATEIGYGASWITSGNYASKEISNVIDFKKEGYSLAAIVPIGVPQPPIKSPGRKPIEDVISIIE